MTEETAVEKPEWNRYDNIFEVMQNQTVEQLNDQLREAFDKAKHKHKHNAQVVLHHDIECFLTAVHSIEVRLPLWKIVIPELDQPSHGAIYYVVETVRHEKHIFRGTFGYFGSGPHESALVEYLMTRVRHCWFEVRSGDYLMGFLNME